MFVQTEVTPNPNSLKFLPGKKVSNSGPYEITNKNDTMLNTLTHRTYIYISFLFRWSLIIIFDNVLKLQ